MKQTNPEKEIDRYAEGEAIARESEETAKVTARELDIYFRKGKYGKH